MIKARKIQKPRLQQLCGLANLRLLSQGHRSPDWKVRHRDDNTNGLGGERPWPQSSLPAGWGRGRLVPVVGKTKHRQRYAFSRMVQPVREP